MFRIYFLSFILLQLVRLSCLTTPTEEAFVKEQITPDIVPIAPTEPITIIYPTNAEVKLGNELGPRFVKEMPKVKWNTEPHAFYTFAMIDPDCPSRTEHQFREWQHWLIVNIPGCVLSKGETLSEHIPAGPAIRTGLHRYVFLVYKQPKQLEFDERHLKNNTGDGRARFKIQRFATKYNLGYPIAGNFFQAQHDLWVDQLYKFLGSMW